MEFNKRTQGIKERENRAERDIHQFRELLLPNTITGIDFNVTIFMAHHGKVYSNIIPSWTIKLQIKMFFSNGPDKKGENP